MSGRGRLFLIVGPSGSGKDTLIDEARRELGTRADFAFPRRVITRPAHAESEDFVSATVAAFEAQERAGAFALSWRSHGLCYGIPAEIDGLIAEGRRVVVNVSRTVVDDARARFTGTHIIQIQVAPDVIRRRLEARGRESAEDVNRRIARAEALTVSGPDVTVIANDGPLERARARFLSVLQGI